MGRVIASHLSWCRLRATRLREQIAQVIQSQMKEVCVEIKNNFVPLQEFNGEMARKRKFKALMMSFDRFLAFRLSPHCAWFRRHSEGGKQRRRQQFLCICKP